MQTGNPPEAFDMAFYLVDAQQNIDRTDTMPLLTQPIAWNWLLWSWMKAWKKASATDHRTVGDYVFRIAREALTLWSRWMAFDASSINAIRNHMGGHLACVGRLIDWKPSGWPRTDLFSFTVGYGETYPLEMDPITRPTTETIDRPIHLLVPTPVFLGSETAASWSNHSYFIGKLIGLTRQTFPNLQQAMTTGDVTKDSPDKVMFRTMDFYPSIDAVNRIPSYAAAFMFFAVTALMRIANTSTAQQWLTMVFPTSLPASETLLPASQFTNRCPEWLQTLRIRLPNAFNAYLNTVESGLAPQNKRVTDRVRLYLRDDLVFQPFDWMTPINGPPSSKNTGS